MINYYDNIINIDKGLYYFSNKKKSIETYVAHYISFLAKIENFKNKKSHLFDIFRINLDDLFELEDMLVLHYHMSDSDIDKLPFWRMQKRIQNLEKFNKQKSEQQKGDTLSNSTSNFKNQMKQQMKNMNPKTFKNKF